MSQTLVKYLLQEFIFRKATGLQGVTLPKSKRPYIARSPQDSGRGLKIFLEICSWGVGYIQHIFEEGVIHLRGTYFFQGLCDLFKCSGMIC